MSDVPDRPTSRGWYLVAFGLCGTAIAIALTGFNQMREVVETLQRKAMPGSQEVALAGGRATIYYEPQSELDNKTYSTPPDLAISCTLANLNGKPHAMQPPARVLTYSSGPYSGRSIYDIDVVAPGSYTLTCQAREPFVLTVGGGVGAWLVVALAGAMFPGLAGLIVIAIVAIKRRRWRVRQAQ